MLRIQQYVKAHSLDEAYELLQKNRNNQIIAGMCWLKMEDRTIPIGIDIADLSLDTIEEDEEKFTIGAMVTLRDLEMHTELNAWCDHIIEKSVRDIVGVQFRNLATIGGSIYSRFGFSDLLCSMLCLDCEVVLHHGGRIPLAEFVHMPYQRDIITHVLVYKRKARYAFSCVRKSATDLSVLNVSASKQENEYRICVGARPYKAMLLKVPYDTKEAMVDYVIKHVPCEDNMRASKEYRMRLVEALTFRILSEIEENDVCK